MKQGSVYNEVLKHELLSADEEQALLRAAQAGDETARERLILCNMRLVYAIAQKYAWPDRGITVDDLIADGVVGLCRAIDKHDFSYSTRLSNYATIWIHQSIARSQCLQGSIRLPEHVCQDIRTLNRAKIELMQNGQPVTTQSLAEHTQLPVEKVERLKHFYTTTPHVSSLDETLPGTDNRQLQDVVPDARQEEDLRQVEIKADLEPFLDKLNEEERFIVERFYGIEIKMSLREIGEALGISTAGAHARLTTIMTRLRRMGAVAHEPDPSIKVVIETATLVIVIVIGEQLALFPQEMKKLTPKPKRKYHRRTKSLYKETAIQMPLF